MYPSRDSRLPVPRYAKSLWRYCQGKKAEFAKFHEEAKQVRIEWVDGRIGRCVVGDAGLLEKCVVIGEHGRDREVERMVLGDTGSSRMEDIGERLREGIY
jgi:central kinetochore subunit Mal2/MCM21